MMVQPLLNLQDPEFRCSKVKSKETICDALIPLFLNHGRFKGPGNALHSDPLSHNEIIGCPGFHLPEDGVSV